MEQTHYVGHTAPKPRERTATALQGHGTDTLCGTHCHQAKGENGDGLTRTWNRHIMWDTLPPSQGRERGRHYEDMEQTHYVGHTAPKPRERTGTALRGHGTDTLCGTHCHQAKGENGDGLTRTWNRHIMWDTLPPSQGRERRRPYKDMEQTHYVGHTAPKPRERTATALQGHGTDTLCGTHCPQAKGEKGDGIMRTWNRHILWDTLPPSQGRERGRPYEDMEQTHSVGHTAPKPRERTGTALQGHGTDTFCGTHCPQAKGEKGDGLKRTWNRHILWDTLPPPSQGRERGRP
ncbi:hypothetical protein ACOMHN_045361 [Nucella lapillus]